LGKSHFWLLLDAKGLFVKYLLVIAPIGTFAFSGFTAVKMKQQSKIC